MARNYIVCGQFMHTRRSLRFLYQNAAALESRAADGIANYANIHELPNTDNAFRIYRAVLETKTRLHEMQRHPGHFARLPAALLASYLDASDKWATLPVECFFFANAETSETGEPPGWMTPQAREEVLGGLIGVMQGIAAIYENSPLNKNY
ncbi:MAG: hypothetical protein J4431_03755 [Candidatus Aenigmarchaeota archaeon]|nr:hypothetical protein [Candidatus Aenigmarchaeota archaeon]